MLTRFFKSYWPLLVILAASAIIFLRYLGIDLLWDWDECLYSVNAREMLQGGHYLTNTWNGMLDFQKPPLYTWILTFFYSFGISEFTTRLFNVIAGLILLGALYVFAKKYFNSIVAVLATLLLLTGEVFVIYMRHASTDMGYTLLVFLGIWSWLEARKNGKYAYLAGLFFGLSTMIKGLGTTQFLAAIFISLFLNIRKESFINFIKVAVVYVAIALPWHLVAYSQYGYEFFRVYILENIVKRSRYPIEFHRERWWFYFVLIWREFFPWLLFGLWVPLYYLKNITQYLSVEKIRQELKEKELIFTIILLVIIPLLMITRVQTRIAWYVMPIYPFLALYLAYSIDFLFRNVKPRLLIYIVIALIAADATKLMLHENKWTDPTRVISPRDEMVIHARSRSEKELQYLVPLGERLAREILPPTEQIPQTWTFGGHPCAVYHSGKKVHYYYFVDDFKKDLASKKGLFLIPNADESLLKDVKIDVIRKNSEFTLFEKQ